MDKKEQIETLVIKYGAIAVSRFFLREALSATANIRNGIETDNFALASKDVGLLVENLRALNILFNGEEKTLKELQQLDKNFK